MISGIYKWTSPSGKSYVGQAINLKKRARQFKTVKYYTSNGRVERREHELVIIIEEEKLKDDETRKFLENAFREGEVKTVGTDIDKIMPPVSRFGGGNRANKKKTVIDRLKAYFEKFYGIGGVAKLSKDETEE